MKEVIDYEVAGAGTLRFGTEISICGNAVGVPVSVSWGKYGHAGGVMDAEQVAKLLDALSEWISVHQAQVPIQRAEWAKTMEHIKLQTE